MGDVIDLDVVTMLEIPPEKVLKIAAKAGLEEVLVIGFNKDGLYHASSEPCVKDILFLVESFKHKLMQVICEAEENLD